MPSSSHDANMSPHLERNDRQICLIRLSKNAVPSSTALCSWEFETQHVSLDGPDLPPYTALSYVWGKSEPGRHKISIHGSLLDITPNLHSAIDSIGKLEDLSSQWLWTDAICIDQADLDERACQVALMRDLYTRAQRTIAYLGPEDDGAELGLSWLEELGRAWTQPSPVDWLENATTSSRHDLEWKTFNAVFDRQWWQRAWILQETVTSRNIHFMFGRKMVDCETLLNAMLLLRSATPTIGLALISKGVWMDGDRSGRFNTIYKRFHLRWWHHHRQRLSIGSIVSQRYHFLASDPRDYVYAIFALVEHTGAVIASPDYTLETWQTYAALVKKYAKAYGNLDILCLATSPRQLPDLPSWAPDLTYRNEPNRTFVHDDNLWLMNLDAEEELKKEGDPNKKKATYRAAGTSPVDVAFSPDLKLLTSRAIYIDTVDGLSGHGHLVTPPHGTNFLTYTHSIAPDLQPLHHASAYGTEESTREAIWRTLLLDRLPEFETEPAPDYAVSLLAYGCVKAEAGQGDRLLTNLWKPMRDFRITDKPLRDWMHGAQDVAALEKTAWRAMELRTQRCKRSYPRDRFEAPIVSSCVHKYLEMQRHLFVTDGGYVGAAPLGTQRGDEGWILFGCNIPLLLRKVSEGGYRVVGECYVHGFMYGEAMLDLESGRRKDCMIELQ